MKSKTKRSSPFKVTYPRVVTYTKKFYLDATGYFTNLPNLGIKHPHVPGHYVVTASDYVGQGKSPDNWKHLVAIGQSATSTHSGRYTRLEATEGTSVVLYADKSVDVITGVIDQSCIGITDPGNGLNPNLVANNLAKARLLKSYLRRKNTWRGGNFVAELRETIEALKHPLKSIYKATYDYAGKVKHLGKVYRKRPHQYGKELSNAWLAYVFGIRPLADDVNDLATALNKLGSSFYSRTKLYGSGHAQSSVLTQPSVSWTVSGHPASPTQIQDRVQVDDATVRYKGAIKMLPMDTNLIIDQFGVGIFDVLPAVWEAIPWSFLIDYFVNVQEVLDGMRIQTADVAWLFGSYRNERSVETSEPYGYLFSSSPPSWLHVGGGGRTFCRMHRREPLPSIPYPAWQFRIPGLTSLKWLNVLALSQQIRSSKPAPFEQYKAPPDRRRIRTIPMKGPRR